MELLADFLNPYILIGAEGILIDGIKRICEWNDECIEVVSGGKIITVCGKGLKMLYKSMDSMLVSGKVERIEFKRVQK